MVQLQQCKSPPMPSASFSLEKTDQLRAVPMANLWWFSCTLIRWLPKELKKREERKRARKKSEKWFPRPRNSVDLGINAHGNGANATGGGARPRGGGGGGELGGAPCRRINSPRTPTRACTWQGSSAEKRACRRSLQRACAPSHPLMGRSLLRPCD